MAAIYSNGGNRWNILGFNFTKRDALSSVYKISMVHSIKCSIIMEVVHKIIHHGYSNCYADKKKHRFSRTNSLGKFKVLSASVNLPKACSPLGEFVR
jgi:hypothetical protein